MSGQVQVEDFEVFRLFRGALLKFAQAAEQSLSGAESEIASIHSWIESEQATYWQGQLRKRTEAVAKARDAVRQKKLYKDSTGRTPGAVEEEKALAKCVAALDQAQEKIEAVRRALPRLEKEADLYRGASSRLMGTVTVEVPRAVALLDRLADTLDQYVQIETPSGNLPEGTPASTYDESMSRGGDAESPPRVADSPATADPPNPLASPAPSETSTRKVPDVADGK